MRSAAARAVVVVGLVTAVAGFLRLDDLGAPAKKVFDEVYYASDGCWYAGLEHRACGLDADVERSWVHPPLGKVMIGWGIDAMGNRAFGWRLVPAIAGTITVALAGALAFTLTGSWLWAGVGSLLTGTEHLLFVQSRIAMLDVLLAMFVVLGFTLLVLDRRRNLDAPSLSLAPAAFPEPAADDTRPWLDSPPEAHGPLVAERESVTGPEHPRPGLLRPLRVAAGAALGAGAAVKWSGALALVAAIILAVAWERTHRKRTGSARPLRAALADQWAGLVVGLIMVPAFLYLLTWIPWLADRGFDLGQLVSHHGDMADYHATLSTVDEDGEPVHPYMSRAWTWFLLGRPVAYHFDANGWGTPAATAEQIIAIGNPLLFWGGVIVVPTLLLTWIVRRRWQAGAIALPILVQYLPWLAVSRPLFLFYMTPVTPFLALGMTLVVRDLARVRLAGRRILAPLAATVVIASVAAFVFFWPLLTGETISQEAWQMRMWFDAWV